MEKPTSMLNLFVRDYGVNALYDQHFESAAAVAKKENWFCSRWQTTGMAIENYVARVFYTISVFVVAVLVRPSIEVCSCKFSSAWGNLRQNGLRVLYSIKLLVVLPFIFIGGFFAPEKVYGDVDKALKETNPKKPDLGAQLAETSGMLKAANAEIAKIKARLKTQGGSLRSAAEEASADAARAREELVTVRASIRDLEEQLAEAGGRANRAERDLSTAGQEVEDSRQQIQSANQRIEELTRALVDAKSLVTGDAAARELLEVTPRLRALEEALGALREQKSACEGRLAEALQAVERANQEKSEYTRQSVELTAVKAELEATHQALEETDLLKRNVRELKDQVHIFLSQSVFYGNAVEEYLGAHPEIPFPGLHLLTSEDSDRYAFPHTLLLQEELSIEEVLAYDADYKESVPWIDGEEHSAEDYDAVGHVAPRVTGLAGIREGMNPGPNNLNVGLFVRLDAGQLKILVIKTQDTWGYELPEEGREDYSAAVYAKAQEGGGCVVEDVLEDKDALFAGTSRSTDHSWDVFETLKVATFSSTAADAIEVEDEVEGKSFEWVNLDEKLINRLHLEYRVLVREHLLPKVDGLKPRLESEA